MIFNKIFLILLTEKYKWDEIIGLKPCDPAKISNNFIIRTNQYDSFLQLYLKGILLNPVFNFEEKCYLECLYVRTLKTIKALEILSRKFKCYKSIKYNNESDLYLNPLKNFKDVHKINIYQNNTLYKFRLSNLINYWVECLYNSEGLFPAPQKLRNPYTNIEFSKANLYNIYFKILETSFTVPTCITDFFLCDMEKEPFLEKHYLKCQEESINNFMKFAGVDEKFEQILNMLHEYRKDIDYITFPHINPFKTQEKASKKFKNVLLFYLKSKFLCNPLSKKKNKIAAIVLIKKMVDEEKYFGFEFHLDVIRYIPRGERRRTQPPPPPPEAVLSSRRRRRSIILPSINLPPPPPPISFTVNPINLLDSDEEEIPILPEIQEEITNEDTTQNRASTDSSNETASNNRNQPAQPTPNIRNTLPEIRNSQRSIRSSLSFSSSISTQASDNIVNMTSPFRPTRELPRSPVNRVIRGGFNIFN